jgi:uncharacterized protein YbjT (DUF2867 family)
MDVVTGSFGYIGKYITRKLISSGKRVKTITTHPDKPNPFGNDVKAYPYNFDTPELLISILKGCDTLFNTYWVRFNYGKWSLEKALRNTDILFDSARKAGIRKIVHISVTNPSESDALPYYRGKALQEKMLKELGISYSIIRPTLVFGKEDILVNNIAWTIRKFPFVPIFGSGDYKVQPVFVEDLASIAVECAKKNTSETLDAIGPETFTYKEMLRVMASILNPDVKFIHVWPHVGIFRLSFNLQLQQYGESLSSWLCLNFRLKLNRNMRSASLSRRGETVSRALDARLCRNELDLDPRPSCFGDLFQSLERKALVLAALDPRNRLLAGAHKLRQLLLRQSFLLAQLRYLHSQIKRLPLFLVMGFELRIFEIFPQPALERPNFDFFHVTPPAGNRRIQSSMRLSANSMSFSFNCCVFLEKACTKTICSRR